MISGRRANALSRARLRWRQANPLVRGLTQVGLVAVLAVAGFGLFTIADGITDTAASVLVAIVVGVATVLQARQTQRRQHTVGLINKFQSTDSLCAADLWMAERISRGQPVEIDMPPAERNHVIALLDYYEFLSTLALRGFVDVRLLLHLRGGTMSRCFRLCREYIEHCQATVGDELYRSFEFLATEHSRQTAGRAVAVASAPETTEPDAPPTTARRETPSGEASPSAARSSTPQRHQSESPG